MYGENTDEEVAMRRVVAIIVLSIVLVGSNGVWFWCYRGSTRDSKELADRYTELYRQDRERQQRIAELSEQCLRDVDLAREAADRIAANTSTIRGNIQSAINLIEQAINEKQSINRYLDSIGTGITDIRDYHRVENN